MVRKSGFHRVGGIALAVLLAGVCVVCGGVWVSSARASFSVEAFSARAENEDGSSMTSAGEHPFAFTTNVRFSQVLHEGELFPEGQVRDAHAVLPPGFIGNPTSLAACTAAQLDTKRGESPNSCPNTSAIGVATITTGKASSFDEPVFNMVPPPGYPAELGFNVSGVPVLLTPHIRQDGTYGLTVDSISTSQALAILEAKITIWGVPYASAHDAERGTCLEENITDPAGHYTCPVSGAKNAYLTMPTNCEEPFTSGIIADSWLEPGVYLSDGEPDLGLGDWSVASSPGEVLNGCGQIQFDPRTSGRATTELLGQPSGLELDFDIEDPGFTSPEGTAQSDLKKAVVTLPEGFTVNPSAGSGLGACSLAEYEAESLHSTGGEGCPEDSKLGVVEVESPAVAGKIEGSVYIASPASRGETGQNPFNSLLAIYVVLRNTDKGVFIKLSGEVQANPVTGQLVTTFDNLPQLPFSHFRFSFYQGSTSPLVSPSTCGSYPIETQLYPWSDPGGGPLVEKTMLRVDNNGDCPNGGTPPFAPSASMGTLNNSAGSYSELDLRIARNDGEQEITGFSTQLPPGMTANLNGIPFCSETDIAKAREQTGAQAETEPACPTGSEIGHTIAGAGVGPVLAWTPGKLYLGGPYEGAPFSIVSVTSAKVGPFDLGTVVVHLPLELNPYTAQVTIPPGPADQIPHIIKGIVIHLREILVYVNRPNFTINPTNCEPQTMSATVIGSGADYANPNDANPITIPNHFQATNCGALKFEPSFSASTSGKTSKADGASLTLKVVRPTGPGSQQANFAKVKVELPVQLPSRLTTLQKACTKAQFEANPAGCPSASVVGHVKVLTPIVPVALEGPAYFVSNGGEAFPNLVFVLQGYGITLDVVSDTFINKAGITSGTLKAVPDQPFSFFELTLPEDPYSALAANGDLCAEQLSIPTEFVSQNKTTIEQKTPVEVEGCPDTISIISHKIKQKTATVSVYIPTAGKIKLSGRGLDTKTKTANGRGTLTINVNQKHAGKLKTKLQIVFTPSTGGTRKRQVKTLTLKFKK